MNTEEKKKQLLDYLQNTKIKIEDYQNLQAFFKRDSEYYISLENYFKDKSNAEISQLFFNECKNRYETNDFFHKKFLELLDEGKIIEDEYIYLMKKNLNELNIENYLNIDNIFQYRNPYVYQIFNTKTIDYNDIFEENIVNYYLDIDRLQHILNNEKSKLKLGKNNIYNLLEKYIRYIEPNLKLTIDKINYFFSNDNDKKQLFEVLKNSFCFNILSPNNFYSPKKNKFYVELDFSMPKKEFIDYIYKLYDEYEKGNVKSYEEFLSELLNENIKEKTKLNEVTFIFKLRNENKYPLYRKLVDLLFIYDSLKLGIKQDYIVNIIEDYKMNFYENFRGSKSSFEKYKKNIISFIDNKEFRNYL